MFGRHSLGTISRRFRSESSRMPDDRPSFGQRRPQYPKELQSQAPGMGKNAYGKRTNNVRAIDLRGGY